MPGNSCELRIQGDAVAVKTVGARCVGKAMKERGPVRADGAVEREQAGGAPRRAVKTRVSAVRSFLGLQCREEREVCQRRQAFQSLRRSGGERSAGQRRAC